MGKTRKMEMDNVTLDLKRNGYAVIPNFISKELCDDIIVRYSHLAKSQPHINGVRYHGNAGFQQVISDAFDVNKNIDQGKHSELISRIAVDLIDSRSLQNLSSEYFEERSIYATRIQYSQTRFMPGTKNEIPFIPHFDRARFLKFYVFLQETNSEQGCLVMSQPNWVAKAELQRQRAKDEGLPLHEMPASNLESFDGTFLPIEATVGTLIIFDSNQPHQHGTINRNAIEYFLRLKKTRHIFMLESQPVSEIKYGYNQKLAERCDI
jgi:hypothetical protein